MTTLALKKGETTGSIGYLKGISRNKKFPNFKNLNLFKFIESKQNLLKIPAAAIITTTLLGAALAIKSMNK